MEMRAKFDGLRDGVRESHQNTYAVVALLLLLVAPLGAKPFIYFQF